MADSRTQAQALIMAGDVMSGAKILTKPGQTLPIDTPLQVRQRSKYVSRGGDKLASVATTVGLEFAGKAVLDVGSSTGGFTDYSLQHGARIVYCVDVGTGQLAYKLRQDGRVVVMERTDIRAAQLPEKVDLIIGDVSFVSLTKILPALPAFLKEGGMMLLMMKPQFEAGKAVADKFKGIISDPAVRQEIIESFESWLNENDFDVLAAEDSGVAGAEGNLERFYLIRPKFV